MASVVCGDCGHAHIDRCAAWGCSCIFAALVGDDDAGDAVIAEALRDVQPSPAAVRRHRRSASGISVGVPRRLRRGLDALRECVDHSPDGRPCPDCAAEVLFFAPSKAEPR